MVERLQRLVELQQLEDQLLAREEEHREIPERRARIQAERESIQARLAESAEALEAAQTSQRAAERTLQDQEALLHKLEGQQFQVKTNEAYTALLHEMEQAREGISECETRILEAMDAIERASAERASAEAAAGTREAGLREQEQTLDAREKELSETIGVLSERRDAMASGVEPEDLATYRRIAGRRRPAVVLVDAAVCLGCRVDIPPQRYIEIRQGSSLLTCGHCTRILIHRERLARQD